MKTDRNSEGDIVITITPDEAQEIVSDEMFDDAETFAVTSRLRDVLATELDMDDVEDDWDEEELDEEQIEGLDERIKGEEIEGID